MRLGILTALDLAGLRPVRQADGSYRHACPTCRGRAWSDSGHTHCLDPVCPSAIFTPLDIIRAAYKETALEACSRVNLHLRCTAVEPGDAAVDQNRRDVMDAWLQAARSPQPIGAILLKHRLSKDGLTLHPGSLNMALLGKEALLQLLAAAVRCGAEVPPTLLLNPPDAVLAWISQSTPGSIDRIILRTRRQSWQLVWNKVRFGLTGLIGTTPGSRRLVALGHERALSGQRSLSLAGTPQEVGFIQSFEGERHLEDWAPHADIFVAAPATRDEVIQLSRFHDVFRRMRMPVMRYQRISSIQDPVHYIRPWERFRQAFLVQNLDKDERELSPGSIYLLEQVNPSSQEMQALVSFFRIRGRLALAEDIKRHMGNRVIYSDKKIKIRETASEYVIQNGTSRTSITNFALELTTNLVFRDTGEIFHAARLSFGKESLDALLDVASLDNPGRLQERVRQPVMAQAHTAALPTVIDSISMRKHILPWLRAQVANLPSTEGVSAIGWSQDRQMFAGPGLRLNLSGATMGRVAYHPNLGSMKCFLNETSWEAAFPEKLPQAAYDLVAMIMAAAVRYYVKSVQKPVTVTHSPEARQLLKAMFAAIGQHEIYELNSNLRDLSGLSGVRGYPLLATGYNLAQAMNAKFGYVLLTDGGYTVAEESSPEDAAAAGRALQAGLVRVAEWCLATQAEEFRERPALHYNTSLLREGQWLMEHVCKLQPWEVSDVGLLTLEEVLSQIPEADTMRRISLRAKDNLIQADLEGLRFDPDALSADLSALSPRSGRDGTLFTVGAAEMLSAMQCFYGREPSVKVAL